MRLRQSAKTIPRRGLTKARRKLCAVARLQRRDVSPNWMVLPSLKVSARRDEGVTNQETNFTSAPHVHVGS